MRRNLCGAAVVVLILIAAGAGQAQDTPPPKSAVSYYQACDKLAPGYPGENVHPNPKLEPGRIGQAFRMEQRWALNLVQDPCLTGQPKDAWDCVGAPAWMKTGGVAGAYSVVVDATNYLRQAIPDLQEGKLCCLSVYANSADKGTLDISIKSGASEEHFVSLPLTGEYRRFKVACAAGAGVAAITIKGGDEKKVTVSAVQFECVGRTFPRAFIPKTKEVQGCEWVDVPPALVNPMKGSVAFWAKPDWIGEVNAGSSFFAAYHTDPNAGTVAWPDQTSLLAIGAYSDPKRKGWENAINVTIRDRKKQELSYSVELDARFKPGEWHHIVVTWDINPGAESKSVFYLNGRKIAEKSVVCDGVEPFTAVYMGFGGGGYADGLMDEFYIFNRPLTESEVAALAAATQPLK